MDKISPHITYKEATNSHTAQRLGIDNTPNQIEMKAMIDVAENCFEPLRNHVDVPIKIESFLRKHTPGSQHYRGEAIDIDDDYGGTTNAEMFYWLAENVEFDQLIWELGDNKSPGWIHVSYKEGRNRRKLTVAYRVERKIKYSHFSSLEAMQIFLNKWHGR